MNKTTKSKPNASSNNRHSLRGSNGRFISATSKVTPKRTSSVKSSVSVKGASKSSFIASMSVQDDLVNVVMNRNPKITYTYKPNKSSLSKIKSAIKSNTGLGTVYNTELRGREVSRTIYR